MIFGENGKKEKKKKTGQTQAPTPQRGLPRRGEAKGGQISTLGYATE